MNEEIKNPNHPKKGSRITVEPIRREKDIKKIVRRLNDKPRDQLLFLMGINNGLRVGDLLQLKVGQVKGLSAGDTLTMVEGKTKKKNVLAINKTVFKALQKYLEDYAPDDEDYLFSSRKGKGALTIQSVNNMVKKWAAEIGLKENYGAHTLRKTFGYIQRTQFGVGFEVLAKRFNHSSPSVTMRYLGIHDKEVNGILRNEIG
ncbi:Integrase family protein [Desulfamplus magnetovallimortis]|uniref:Integrase family protein n=1 Tax=Desulfamplus magnetovallimortis TaxID=1246637 RepID=A0A1W1HE64_9BACT|nr:site-specific integrase [Desulfamplus magnetovallimortis]SLM30769.1 Integrase family protein [Desulfamplus magnetovallimortis]